VFILGCSRFSFENCCSISNWWNPFWFTRVEKV